MPRPPRSVEPGGFYHVTARGNDRRAIFDDREDDLDRRHLLVLLDRAVRRHEWIVFAYCLMSNHVHLLLQVRDSGLSSGMQGLLGGYARFWNSRHGRTGHLFSNRFRSSAVQSERHLMATARYVELNPVRAGMTARPEEWPWSSYRAVAGLDHAPAFLATSALLELFGPTPATARQAYQRFVLDGRVPQAHGPVSDT